MSGFNIGAFRSQGIINGGVRPTQFTVSIQFPTLVSTPNLGQRVNFLCRSASLPDSSIRPIEIPYFGRSIKVNGDREFSDWTVRVIMDDFQIRDALLAWHNSINTIVSNRMDPRVAGVNPTLGGSYKTVAMVTSFDKTGPGDVDGDGVLSTYRFDGIFPTQVGPVSLDWDDKNRIAEFDVTFAYDWYDIAVRASDPPIFDTELSPA